MLTAEMNGVAAAKVLQRKRRDRDGFGFELRQGLPKPREIGGIGGTLDRACDPAMPVAEIYRGLIDRQRIMFLIGDRNRARGFEPPGGVVLQQTILRIALLHQT